MMNGLDMWGWPAFHGVGGLLALAVLVFVGIVLVRLVRHRLGAGPRTLENSPHGILQSRHARGEIAQDT